jgi:hypothetical protein
VIGIKTDCFFLDCDLKQLASFWDSNKHLFDSTQNFSSIGKWKLGNKGICPSKLFQYQENELIADVISCKSTETSIFAEENWKTSNV